MEVPNICSSVICYIELYRKTFSSVRPSGLTELIVAPSGFVIYLSVPR